MCAFVSFVVDDSDLACSYTVCFKAKEVPCAGFSYS
ncbi:hypothetical protein SBA7_620014 [Candidatus Sulfotelmatobacter sp. SbA7]|nr:hypothetical protein SBA7_620014 [Candidatus Sulfotelmatobacter sp. SbA7]